MLSGNTLGLNYLCKKPVVAGYNSYLSVSEQYACKLEVCHNVATSTFWYLNYMIAVLKMILAIDGCHFKDSKIS